MNSVNTKVIQISPASFLIIVKLNIKKTSVNKTRDVTVKTRDVTEKTRDVTVKKWDVTV